MSEGSAAPRECGECSLCCRLLKVESLAKPGGTPCPHLGPPGTGCSIHERRPPVCRGYRCLWLQGGLDPGDRPDRLGAIVDLVAAGDTVRLSIREARPGAYDASPRLQEIARRFGETMSVRIADADDPLDPDRPYRVLLPNGDIHFVEGDRVRIVRGDSPDLPAIERRLPWLERGVRRVSLAVQAWRWRRRLRRPMGVPGEAASSASAALNNRPGRDDSN